MIVSYQVPRSVETCLTDYFLKVNRLHKGFKLGWNDKSVEIIRVQPRKPKFRKVFGQTSNLEMVPFSRINLGCSQNKLLVHIIRSFVVHFPYFFPECVQVHFSLPLTLLSLTGWWVVVGSWGQLGSCPWETLNSADQLIYSSPRRSRQRTETKTKIISNKLIVNTSFST